MYFLIVLMLRSGCMSSSKENVTTALEIRSSRSWSESLESLTTDLSHVAWVKGYMIIILYNVTPKFIFFCSKFWTIAICGSSR